MDQPHASLTELRGNVVAQVDAATGRLGAGDVQFLPVLHDVGEGEMEVVVDTSQVEVAGVEVDEGVEEDVG